MRCWHLVDFCIGQPVKVLDEAELLGSGVARFNLSLRRRPCLGGHEEEFDTDVHRRSYWPFVTIRSAQLGISLRLIESEFLMDQRDWLQRAPRSTCLTNSQRSCRNEAAAGTLPRVGHRGSIPSHLCPCVLGAMVCSSALSSWSES